MFDIGAAEILVIAIVAILVIGPKDMPLALRTAGRWIGQIRLVSGHFRAGIDAMVREAEIEEMEKKWKDRNAEIMRAHPGEEMTELPSPPSEGEAPREATAENPVEIPETHDPNSDDPAPGTASSASAEARAGAAHGKKTTGAEEPQLPLESDRPTRGGKP